MSLELGQYVSMNIHELLLAYQKESTQYLTVCFDEQN